MSFGIYEQDDDLTNGKKPIEWQIIDIQKDKALLISKYALDCKSYNGLWVSTNWEECTLRTWLNGTFLNEAFSLEEQKCIKLNDTSDKLFLLSIMEAKQYFSSDVERQCIPTEHTMAKKCHINQNNGNCWWWLRSQGNNPYHAAKVLSNGSIDELGSSIEYAFNAIRPAVWVDVSVLR